MVHRASTPLGSLFPRVFVGLSSTDINSADIAESMPAGTGMLACAMILGTLHAVMGWGLNPSDGTDIFASTPLPDPASSISSVRTGRVLVCARGSRHAPDSIR
jgi:hypothetical protein